MGKERGIVLFESTDRQVCLDVGFDGGGLAHAGSGGGAYSTTKQNVGLHVNNCFREGELEPEAVVKDSLTTAADGKRSGNAPGPRHRPELHDGTDVYPTLEEKAANLLYFLDRSGAPFTPAGEKVIDDSALVAESNPDEKEVMVSLVRHSITRA